MAIILKESFVKRFDEMLKRLNITQQDVADKSGVSKSLISRYASGKVCPKVDNISAIAYAYGVNPSWLVGYDVPFLQYEKDKEGHINHLRDMIMEKVITLNEEDLEKTITMINVMFPNK